VEKPPLDPSPPSASLAALPAPASLRREYAAGQLLESAASPNAMDQFAQWFADAQRAAVSEPNAMTVATVDPAGRPSARIVLMKDFDQRGIVFYTNYQSRKGRELAGNPAVSAVFFWELLERQVRVEGTVEQVTRAETESYFATRPRSSQIGAWVSQQSSVITSRAELERLDDQIRSRFDGQNIPPPPHWGGYRILPAAIEFWQGRRSRLHDRLLYTRDGQQWTMQRLAP
jgi:pyridoxamine 5'-phosphate oxidase